MQKLGLFLVLLLSFLSCKDGIVEVPEFTFEAPVYTCDTYTLHVRNTDNTKALILNLDAADLPNTVGTQTLTNSGRSVLYRIFDGAITSGYFCAAVPPSSPQVVEEWQATSFGVTIETVEDTSTTPISYHHSITLSNMVLVRNGVEEVFESFYFGTVITQ